MRSKLFSLALHIAVFLCGYWLPGHVLGPLKKEQTIQNVPVRLRLSPPPTTAPGPGGGGNRSPTPPSLGSMRFARHTFVPLPAKAVNLEPELVVEPGMAVKLDASFQLPTFGDPAGVPGPPSLGGGKNGIGSTGNGGYGDQAGSGIQGSYRNLATTDPELISRVEPEYSEEGRKARVSGMVVLQAVVDTDGKIRSVRVVQGLGLGLDEKAAEAVQRWRFRPARRGSQPVPVMATIYVNFRLL